MAKERFIVVVGRVVFGATALMADEARMRNKQSVHLKARVVAILRDSAVLKGVGASEGLSFFCNGRGDREVRCNGRGKPLALRKARGIVQM